MNKTINDVEKEISYHLNCIAKLSRYSIFIAKQNNSNTNEKEIHKSIKTNNKK